LPGSWTPSSRTSLARNFGDREHALGGFRLGGAPELQGRHLRDVDGALAERGQQGGAARGVGQLRRDEHPADRER
jgi:hypothetical protein